MSGSGVKSKIIPSKKFAEKLLKAIIRKLEKREVYSSLKENIWGADLADMELLSKFNKGFRFSLCITDIYSKYAWIVPLKDKKVLQLLRIFKKY